MTRVWDDMHPAARRRIQDKIWVSDIGCWLWTGPMNDDGYAQLSWKGQSRPVTHILFHHLYGGRWWPHRVRKTGDCPSRSCVRPKHHHVYWTYGEEVALRIWDQVEFRDDGCWVWTGATNGEGYPQISWHGETRPVTHVLVHLWYGGARWPSSVWSNDECDRRRCVRPAHHHAYWND